MTMSGLKFDGYSIVMQEVPDEISLALNITGCPYHCAGCHSPNLWEDQGEVLATALPELLMKYCGLITCVCFMGGDQNLVDLAEQCKVIREFDPHLRIALYTGNADIECVRDVIKLLDYIKVGPYVEESGGLESPTTNQRMYRVYPDGTMDDITHKFRKVYD